MQEKKIKICFFSPASYPFFVPENNSIHGGAEFQMFLLAKFLSQNPRFNISFIVGNYRQKSNITYSNIKLIKAFKLNEHEHMIIKILKAVHLLMLFIKIKPDVIITSTASAIVGISCLYKILFGEKHIHRTAHLMDVNNEWIKKHKVTGKIYKKGLLNADIILTQNKNHKLLLKKIHDKEAIVLKNAFPISSHTKQEKQHILWVGRFQKWKNPELFLELANSNPDEKFVMICPYNPSDYKKWLDLKQNAEKIPNLRFIEKIPFFEIQDYFNKAKLFVNTSDYEGFPNTFLQAAQGKTPIISLNVNPDNFINEYNCGIYCKNNFKLLIEQSKRLLQNPDELKQKGENAYKYLKENHDINKIGKQLKEIIEELFTDF